MFGWKSWLRGRAGRIDRTAPPVRKRSGGLTPPGFPAPHSILPFLLPSACDVLDPRLRPLVADALGVGPDQLTPEVSLTDELAADSLDLLELVLAVETEFDIPIPERTIEELRTYGDLLTTVTDLVAARRPAGLDGRVPRVWARVIPGDQRGSANVERALQLTPYAAQTIVEDVMYAGRGARLEVDLPPGTPEPELVAVQRRFAELGARGVQVSVRRRTVGPPAPPVNVIASASR